MIIPNHLPSKGKFIVLTTFDHQAQVIEGIHILSAVRN